MVVHEAESNQAETARKHRVLAGWLVALGLRPPGGAVTPATGGAINLRMVDARRRADRLRRVAVDTAEEVA